MKKARTSLLRPCARGFSLLELLIVVLLLAGVMAIIIPSINSLSGTKVKEQVMRIAGLTNEVYAKAAVSGITHRINFDLENNTYWVEQREGEISAKAPDLGYDELIVQLRAKEKNFGKEKRPEFVPKYKAVEGFLGEKYNMPKGLALYGAWTDQMKDVARTGVVSIYFFSGGYTQTSFVSVAEKGDEHDSAMYIALSPLTGAASINFGEPSTASLLDEQSDSKQ
ncbi:MAG TPA: prepilin-type N-terminal cleavage/methylation domain-containing protein [Myxococcota bacterium]|nr:prepilin-type N-terminal cleavage/methylation domain-containing protein [Myxococcota bacterium]